MAGDTVDRLAPALPGTAEDIIGRIDKDTACVVVQSPNVFGELVDLAPIAEAAHRAGALLVAVVTEIVSLGAIVPPGDQGAPTSSSPRASRSATGSASAVPMSACSPRGRNTSGRCRAASAARRSTRKAGAASC